MEHRNLVFVLSVGLTWLLLIGLLVGGVGPLTDVVLGDKSNTTSDDNRFTEQSVAKARSAEQSVAAVPNQEFEDENTSRVRALHISPFLPALTLEVDFETVAQNLTFGEASEYERVESEEKDFEILRAEDEEEIFETESVLEPDTNYTVLAVATVTENETVRFQPALLVDDYEIPDEDSTSVRFVHASPDTPAVDVTVAETNTTVADNVSFRNDGTYVTLPADEVRLQVRRATADNDGEIIHRAELSLEGGAVQSAVLTGYRNPEQAPVDAPLDIGVFQDDQRETDEEND